MNIGKTGEFPLGKLNQDDEGQITLRVASDPINNVLIIDFGTPVKWLGLPKSHAIEFANMILKRARELK